MALCRQARTQRCCLCVCMLVCVLVGGRFDAGRREESTVFQIKRKGQLLLEFSELSSWRGFLCLKRHDALFTAVCVPHRLHAYSVCIWMHLIVLLCNTFIFCIVHIAPSACTHEELYKWTGRNVYAFSFSFLFPLFRLPPLVLPPPSSAGPGPTPSTDDSRLSPRPANSCGSCGPAGLPNAPWLQLQAWLQWVASVRAHTRCTFMNRCNFQSSFYVWCFTCFSPSKQGRVLPFSHTRSLVVSQKTSSPL